MKNSNNKQFGAVSLFAVIFATLLITIVTVGFVALMLKDQQEATANELSQSAYDSALAGVEDAKRALIRLQNSVGTPTFDSNLEAIRSQKCLSAVNELSGVGTIIDTTPEVQVTSGSINKFDQAYTCVKITIDTPDYLGHLNKGASKLVKLSAVGNYNKIKIEWATNTDLGGTNFVTTSSAKQLIDSWPLLQDRPVGGKQSRPSIMRTQLIQYANSGFSLPNFDQSPSGIVPSLPSASSSTLFLYPSPGSLPSPLKFTLDRRGMNNVSSSLVSAKCTDITLIYACSQEIELPSDFITSDHTVYLNLTSLYAGADFKITLLNTVGGVVNFMAVQPEVDSTGRANDLFRRIKARIEGASTNNFPYPKAAVDIADGLCKDFAVTNSEGDYTSYCPAS